MKTQQNSDKCSSLIAIFSPNFNLYLKFMWNFTVANKIKIVYWNWLTEKLLRKSSPKEDNSDSRMDLASRFAVIMNRQDKKDLPIMHTLIDTVG